MLKHPWRKTQPVAPANVNPAHPLAKHLLELTQVTPAGIRSAITQKHSTTLGATIVQGYAQSGLLGRQAAAVSSTQYEQVELSPINLSGPFTLYARVSVGTLNGDAGTGVSTARYIYSIAAGGGTIGFGCPASGEINAVSYLGANRVNTTISGASNTLYDCFLSHPGGNAGFTLEVFGVSSNTTSTSTPSVSLGYGTAQIGINFATSAPGDKRFFVGALFNKVLTAEEIASLARNPWALFKSNEDVVLTAGTGAGPQTVNITHAAETDTAQALAVSLGAVAVVVSATTEADAAQAITAIPGALSLSLTHAVESDAAQAITPVPGAVTVLLGAATESDTAQAITALVAGSTSVSAATETDAAQAITPVPGAVTIALSAATETDAAQAIAALNGVTVSLGAATELGSVGAITVVPGGVIVTLNAAAETGTAQALSAINGGVVTPDARILQIAHELRTLTVVHENRTRSIQ